MKQPASPQLSPKYKSFKDLVTISVIAIIIFLISFHFRLFHQLAEWEHLYGVRRFDEIFTVFIFLSFAFAIFSFRRWQELRLEIYNRKQAEEEVRVLNQELNKKITELVVVNKELEAFNYSLSHDLRNPLQLIGGFSNALLKHYSDQMESDVVKKLEIIYKSAAKMECLMNSLLNYSRSGNQEIKLTYIEMTQLVKDVLEELQPLTIGRRIDFHIDSLPPVYGDQVLLSQVFVNLLSNAIKYSRTVDNACIEISGRKEKDKNIYFVRDNGVGFDHKQQDKIFGIFQRLHKEEEFEGNGVGLSIVDRIIQRHKGEVWAEGKINAGATFYFSLPNHTPEG